jgi:hypothetical protein
MDKKSIIILILIGVVIFVIGGGVGVLYKTEKTSEQPDKNLNMLSSRVISKIVAYGEVTEINKKNITLSFMEENLTFEIKENIPIYKIVGTEQASAFWQDSTFNEIKEGNRLNVNLKINENNQTKIVAVYILSPAFD